MTIYKSIKSITPSNDFMDNHNAVKINVVLEKELIVLKWY